MSDCTGIGCHCVRCGHLDRINTLNIELATLTAELAELEES